MVAERAPATYDGRMTLDDLPLDAVARIVDVGGSGPFRRRLLEHGLLPDTRVRRTGAAPLGDPKTFQVRGAVLALRRVEARQVRVIVEEAL